MNDILGIQPTPDPFLKPAHIPYAPITNVASKDQLALPYQRVKLHNTDPVHTHIIVDRFLQGHVLKPGQNNVEIEMLATDIQSMLHWARSDRGFYTSGPNAGKPFPSHPVKLEGLTPIKTDPKKEEPQGLPVDQPRPIQSPIRK